MSNIRVTPEYKAFQSAMKKVRAEKEILKQCFRELLENCSTGSDKKIRAPRSAADKLVVSAKTLRDYCGDAWTARAAVMTTHSKRLPGAELYKAGSYAKDMLELSYVIIAD